MPKSRVKKHRRENGRFLRVRGRETVGTKQRLRRRSEPAKNEQQAIHDDQGYDHPWDILDLVVLVVAENEHCLEFPLNAGNRTLIYIEKLPLPPKARGFVSRTANLTATEGWVRVELVSP
jgi:hypothetical protein